jgi:hypothetical protein
MDRKQATVPTSSLIWSTEERAVEHNAHGYSPADGVRLGFKAGIGSNFRLAAMQRTVPGTLVQVFVVLVTIRKTLFSLILRLMLGWAAK